MKKILKKIWYHIKEFLKKVRNFLYRNPITELIPVKNQILVESIPDFADNSYAFYKVLLKHDYQKKYKIIWMTQKDEINSKFKRDDIYYFNEYKKGVINFLKKHWLINRSKFIITCNRFYHKKTKKQTIIYLTHGMPLKDCTKIRMNYYDTDFSISNSDFFLNELAPVLNIPKDKFEIFQSPRNDDLFDKSIDIKKKMYLENKKVIVWLPTFRNMSNSNRIDSTFDMPLGLPILYKIQDIEKLNEQLKNSNVFLILKPHFAQDLSKIKTKIYSNFKIMYNKDLDDLGISLYHLLGQSDGLITDYSSVYYDYLLTNKPVGLTIDDLKEYSENLGITYDYKTVVKGHYIENLSDFIDFVNDISLDKDTYKKERDKTLKLLNMDMEGNYSEKIFKYLQDRFNF